jgi:hypothetical protein
LEFGGSAQELLGDVPMLRATVLGDDRDRQGREAQHADPGSGRIRYLSDTHR